MDTSGLASCTSPAGLERAAVAVVREGNESPTESHAPSTRVGEAELQGNDRFLAREACRCQHPEESQCADPGLGAQPIDSQRHRSAPERSLGFERLYSAVDGWRPPGRVGRVSGVRTLSAQARMPASTASKSASSMRRPPLSYCPADQGETESLDQIGPTSGDREDAIHYSTLELENALERTLDEIASVLTAERPDLDLFEEVVPGAALPLTTAFLISTPETTATRFSVEALHEQAAQCRWLIRGS